MKKILLMMISITMIQNTYGYVCGRYKCYGTWKNVQGGARVSFVNNTDEQWDHRIFWRYPNHGDSGWESLHYGRNLAPGEESIQFDCSYECGGIIEFWCTESDEDRLLGSVIITRDDRKVYESDGNRCPSFEGTWDDYKVYLTGGVTGGPVPEWIPILHFGLPWENRSGRPWRGHPSFNGNTMPDINIPYGDMANPSSGNYDYTGEGQTGVDVDGVDIDWEWGEDTDHDGIPDTWHPAGGGSYIIDPTEYNENEDGDHVYDPTIPPWRPPYDAGYDEYDDPYGGLTPEADTAGVTQDDMRQAFERALENQNLSKWHNVDATIRALDARNLSNNKFGEMIETKMRDVIINEAQLTSQQIADAIGLGDVEFDSTGIEDKLDANRNAMNSKLDQNRIENNAKMDAARAYLAQLADYNLTNQQKLEALRQLADQGVLNLGSIDSKLDRLAGIDQGIMELNNGLEVEFTGDMSVSNVAVDVEVDNSEMVTGLGRIQTVLETMSGMNGFQVGRRNLKDIYDNINESNVRLGAILDKIPESNSVNVEVEAGSEVDLTTIEERLASITNALAVTEYEIEEPEETSVNVTNITGQYDEMLGSVNTIKTEFTEWMEGWKVDIPPSLGTVYEIGVNLPEVGFINLDMSPYSSLLAIFRKVCLFALVIMFIVASLKIMKWSIS